MTKTINLPRVNFVSILAIITMLFVFSVVTQNAYASINSQLDPGSTGSEVTKLQQFLSTNQHIYPEGIVSGTYGPLTEAAVVQFQVAYNLPQVGRVGPATQERMNDIMASGLGLDTSAPIMSNSSIQASNTSATINWTTNELANGQVYYSTYPVQFSQAVGYSQPYSSNQSSQSVNINGLQPNTVYNYINRSVDGSGNVTTTVPNTFRTNN